MCSRDPNVTVCPEESTRHGGGLGVVPSKADDLVERLSDALGERPIELFPFNPIVRPNPDIFVNDTWGWLVHLDDRHTALLEGLASSRVPRFVGVEQWPSWAPADRVRVPASVIESSVTFEDSQGVVGGGPAPASVTPPAAQTYSVSLPRGFDLDDAALNATLSLRIADRAQVRATGGGFASVVSTGTAETNVGVDAQTGPIASVGPVVLRDRARVNGTLATGSTLALPSGATVTGARSEHQTLAPYHTLSWLQQPGLPRSAILVEPDRQASIEPDSYGAVSVKSRSTLALSTGTYFVESLTVEPQARLLLDSSDGPIILVVQNGLTFRGALVGAEAESVLISYAGSAPITIESSIAAPSSHRTRRFALPRAPRLMLALRSLNRSSSIRA